MGKLYTDICSFQEDNLTLQVNLPFSQSTDVLKLPLQIGAKTESPIDSRASRWKVATAQLTALLMC